MLAYAGVLRLPRWCRQNSHVTCSKKDGGSLPACTGIFCIAWFFPEYSKVLTFTCLGGCSGVRRVLKKLLNQVNPCTSISILPTCCITAPKYGGLYRTFLSYVILSFCRCFSSYECKNEKWPTSCGVKFRLYQNMSNFMINYESVSARPRFRLNPQPDPSTLYLYNPNVSIFVIK